MVIASLCNDALRNDCQCSASLMAANTDVAQVLGSNESRTAYDYALAHPREHMIAYYARYGSRAYAQMKIPAQYSITGLILIISFIQYMSRKMSHEKVGPAPAQGAAVEAHLLSQAKLYCWEFLVFQDDCTSV